MIEISTKQKESSVIIRQVGSSGSSTLDQDTQNIYEELKPKLDSLVVHPSAACVQAVVRYAQLSPKKG